MRFSLRLVFNTLFLIFYLFFSGTNGKANHKENVVCLFGSWAVYHKGKAQFSIQDIAPATSICTHLIYAYIGLENETYEVKSRDLYADSTENNGLGGISKTVDLKKNNTDLKVMVGLGSWVEGSVKYSEMVAVKSRRQTFIKSLKNFFQKYKLDGLDLSWTYPADRGGKRNDKENLLLLAKELRTEFDKNGWILSLTLPASETRIRKGYHIKELAPFVDFFNVQSFEYHSFQETRVKPFSPLRSTDEGGDVERTINFLEGLGAPLSKLNLGISAISSTFKLRKNITENETVINQPTTRQGFLSEYLHSSGYIGYNEICMLQSTNEWCTVWDKNSSTSFLAKTNKAVSFDGVQGVKAKAAFAVKKKLGGIFFHRLDLDDFRQNCNSSESKFPLLKTVGDEVFKVENVKVENKVASYVDLNLTVEDSPNHEERVVCYLARWGLYLLGNGKFDIADAAPALHLCTHVVYNFVILDDLTFKIRSAEPYRDLPEKDYAGGLGGITKTVRFKQKFPHLKVMVGCGGWDDGSQKYSQMTNIKARRKSFIESAVEFLKNYKLDGLDLNWQFPADRGGNAADKTNFVLLAKEMRDEFDKHGLILSLAVSSFPYRIALGYDVENLAKHAHFLNVLSYEYHGFWDKKVGAGAPLFPANAEDGLNIETTLDLYEKLGVPPGKINLGMSNYGMTFYLNAPLDGNSTDIIGKPAKEFGFKGPYNNVDGFVGYNEVCLMIKEPNWRVFWDEKTKTKFAVNGERVMSFDDEETYEEKVKYAMKRKLGGFIYYSLEKDDFRNDCHHSVKYPLLNKIVSSIYQYSELLYEDLLGLMRSRNAHYFWNLGEPQKEPPALDPAIAKSYFPEE